MFAGLHGKPGIILVDQVEWPPNIVVVAEAEDRQELARFVVQALAAIEHTKA